MRWGGGRNTQTMTDYATFCARALNVITNANRGKKRKSQWTFQTFQNT